MKNERKSKLVDFFNKIKYNWDSCGIEQSTGSPQYNCDSAIFEIPPIEFLKYAIDDQKLSNNRGNVNALSNVKRAIECQSEVIHFSLGIPYEKLSFPQKLDNLEMMGISPSLIFKKINKIRIELEHYYRKPESDFVEDSIQIAQLFLDSTKLSLGNFPDAFAIVLIPNENNYIIDQRVSEKLGMAYHKLHNGIDFAFNDDKKEFRIKFLENGITNDIIIDPNQNFDDYLILTKFSIAIGKDLTHSNEFLEKQLVKDFISDLFG